MSKKASVRFAYGAVGPAFVLVVVLASALISLLIYLSFHSFPLGAAWTARKFVGIENYKRIFADPETLHSVILSLCYPPLVTLGALLMGLSAALATVNRGPKTKAFITTCMIVPQTLPYAVSGLMWKLILNTDFGILNYFLRPLGARINWLGEPSWALFSIILVDIWRASAFMSLVSLAALETVPKELYEAADIDGAKFRQKLFNITFPLIRPVLLMACLLQIIACAHVFDHIYILTAGGPGTATNLLSLAAYRSGLRMGFMGEGAVYAVLVAIIAFGFSAGFMFMMRKRQEE